MCEPRGILPATSSPIAQVSGPGTARHARVMFRLSLESAASPRCGLWHELRGSWRPLVGRRATDLDADRAGPWQHHTPEDNEAVLRVQQGESHRSDSAEQRRIVAGSRRRHRRAIPALPLLDQRHDARQASGTARNDQDLAAAHLHCQGVLAAQIDALAPRVIIASGKAAADSLYALGLLSSRWDAFRRGFAEGAYHEITTRNGRTIHVYCTYHTAARAVNTVAAPLYSPHTDALLRRKAEATGRVDQVQAFLAPYFAGRQDATSQGLPRIAASLAGHRRGHP